MMMKRALGLIVSGIPESAWDGSARSVDVLYGVHRCS